jgi:hypothetical protein
MIIRLRCFAAVGLALVLAIVPTAQAQQSPPHVGYVYPAGGRQGAEFSVTVGGQYLDGVAKAFVSGPGVTATVVEHVKPMMQGEFNRLRDKLQELQKKTRDTEIIKEMIEIRKKLATFVKRPPNPTIAETVTLRVTMAADAEPGPREIRLVTPTGLTNPLAFFVGQLAEFSKKPVKIIDESRLGKGAKYRIEPKGDTSDAPTDITLPAVVNGQIKPGGADRYRFSARKGLELVVVAGARQLIPYLADAVPGWFQAALRLSDAQGHELAYSDHYLFHPDPVLHYTIPADGQYVVEIHDSVYRGREDFVYRVTLGELPFVTNIFPLGGPAGADTAVDVQGWNLPLARLDAQHPGPGTFPLSLGRDEGLSHRVPFAVDTLPECREQEPNNQPATAQRVTLPTIVNGRIDPPGDWDVFSFAGHAGQEIVAEVYARRLDSPLDSVLKLCDAAGRQLAFNDDHDDQASGLNTHHADSYLRATLPGDGIYYLHLGDVQHNGGPDFAYRLRISPPRPDFELRVVPSSINVRPGGTVPVSIYALRKDGFSGEIAIDASSAAEGFTLSGGRVPAGQDRVRCTLSAPSMPREEPFTLALEGRAVIQGHAVVHPAVPAEDMMQAFEYRHLVPAKELKVAVGGRPSGRTWLKILDQPEVQIPAGGTARLRVATPNSALQAGQVQLELSEPPEGIAVKSVSPAPGGLEIVLQSDAAKVKPGLKGNLIVAVFLERTGLGKKGKPGKQRRVPVAMLPAIPFEIMGL